MLRFFLLSVLCICITGKSFARGNFVLSSNIQQKFADSIFHKQPDKYLLADGIVLLDTYQLVKSVTDALSLNISVSAISYHQRQHYFNALPQQLDFYSKANLLNHQAGLYKMMAVTETLSGDLDIAYHHFSKALFLYQAQLNHAQVAQTSSYLYQLSLLSGDDKAAADFNDMAIAGYRIMEQDQKLVKALLQQNELMLRAGNLKQAEQQILTKILLMAYRMNSKQAEMNCYQQLGRVYWHQNKFTEAKWFFVQANILANKLHHRVGTIRSLLMLAKVKNRIKDYGLALADLKLANSLLNTSNKYFRPDILKGMALTYQKLGDEQQYKRYKAIYNKEQENYVYLNI
ncbi:hypothetical protein FYC62_11915 [Pedobacter aquae]|uniref:Tetratricopeptide repeat protein n=1 Tax=Pedobacter aquae TaxID=2605747 RepID=A0A5C0VHU7_9SPHI|nr:hypothetical protein [Pedobacter aquae]QEK52268.1 hypothetical protein FYC62_11915 [Pedobacter aquae]